MEEKRIICGIYKITSPSGRVYVGQAVDIRNRWREYRGMYKKIKKQPKLYRSLKKYGVGNHTFEILEESLIEDLNCRERHWQDYFEVIGTNGLNLILQECGEERRIISEETSRRLSEAGKGKKHSDESKILIGLKSLGRVHNEEAREKNRQWHLGKKLSEESIKKRSLTNSKLILNIENGIFYIGVKEAAESLNININTLRHKLAGFSKNNTPFIYV